MASALRETAKFQVVNSRPRILLVEDEPLIRIVTADDLESDGFEIFQAATAAEAIAQLNGIRRSLDAAILDIGLPGPDGTTLLAHLRSSDPDLPIVIATGYSIDVVKKRFCGVSRLALVEKPYTGTALILALRRLGVSGRDMSTSVLDPRRGYFKALE